MKYAYDINDEKTIKRLKASKKFIKYPDMFLSNTCQVRVNGDDYLTLDEFTLYCSKRILPRKICIYGKKYFDGMTSKSIYTNYWLEVFLETIEDGQLCKADFKKSNSKLELTIGLNPFFRREAFNYFFWTRKNIIDFLICLFNVEVEEVEFEQQDILDLIA